ncbi:hypothetical protein GLW05_15425 [Pontibacillus yanchengensis]|uniref:RNA-directed DNA polymerase n=1 Tax=Pontibacillus yanchengensis TaxID=462910 RepID=A0A6I5A053_9BACI|nr:reverse transcriptase family protein [Pontibacillus yanchengensis]MYL34974.1 hypothetical protein [Pontibacillus yanchengensis]
MFIYNEDFFYGKILNCRKDALEDILSNKSDEYQERIISKKGGKRYLSCLSDTSSIATLQRGLSNKFLDHIPVPDYVYGFIKGKSYKDYLVPHKNREFYLRVDIKDFFSSINKDLVKEVLDYYIRTDNDTLNKNLIDIIYDIVSLNDSIPQGAITSPSISNIVFRSLDIRINKYCRRFGITYTRYADDLLFSSNNSFLHNKYFLKKISHILQSKRFNINSNKVIKSNKIISLNGFVVGEKIWLSRKRLHDINKVLYLYKTNTFSNINSLLYVLNSSDYIYRKTNNNSFTSKMEIVNYLAGYRSFLLQWYEFQNGDNKNFKLLNKIDEIERILIEIEQLK